MVYKDLIFVPEPFGQRANASTETIDILRPSPLNFQRSIPYYFGPNIL